jgi:hypothetical protein
MSAVFFILFLPCKVSDLNTNTEKWSERNQRYGLLSIWRFTPVRTVKYMHWMIKLTMRLST